MQMTLSVTKKQAEFMQASADEVLYGGAAGGGKSYGQVVDAFLFGLRYKGSRQLLLRSSFPALERSLILTALTILPKAFYVYSSTKHIIKLKNGSVLEFGYLASDADVTIYQSAEYDVIRFDELTHFTAYQYIYMLSRLRGANTFPKQMKSTTNPGSRGHTWVKSRFIDPAPPGEVFGEDTTRVFIPAKIQDNKFLMEKDKDYIKRLRALPENEKKALLYGEWDIFEGQFFGEFDRGRHVVAPSEIPAYHKRFRSMDYGLDMTACHWWAVDGEGNLTVYREFYQSGLTLSEAAKEIVRLSPPEETIAYTVASPDLWNRRQDTGKSGIEIMAAAGLVGLVRADNRRVAGWRVLREYLRQGKICFFSHCLHIIRTLPALLYDKRCPEDAQDSPHEITHAPESIRYGVMSRPPLVVEQKKLGGKFTPGELADIADAKKDSIRRRE
ncbi:MAG: terminase family protein [Clostridia bacterium]|nr:terminase family protein [Clostridia bacterium]